MLITFSSHIICSHFVLLISSSRYYILNPNIIPKGFVDNKKASELILSSISLDNMEYRIGHSKVDQCCNEVYLLRFIASSDSVSLISFIRLCVFSFPVRLQVFFRAGVLAKLEDMRDERLAKIITMLQAQLRGTLMRIEFKRMVDRRSVCVCVSWCLVRDGIYFGCSSVHDTVGHVRKFLY